MTDQTPAEWRNSASCSAPHLRMVTALPLDAELHRQGDLSATSRLLGATLEGYPIVTNQHEMAYTITPEALSFGPCIAEIRALTGLTIDQVGRLFGVSRRSVHNWINGNAMAPHNEEHAAKILSVVRSLPGSTPHERRSALFDSSSRGRSLFHELVAMNGISTPLQTVGVSARERLAQ